PTDPMHGKVHLLNVSRANMSDPHLKAYLAQNGISKETLVGNKKVLFVDTGFSGTIPKTIVSLFPGQESHLQTHLMCSSNPSHPSTRTFLTALNSAAPDVDPGSMHGTIISYQHMPRYTDRSTRYEEVSQKHFEPMSEMSTAHSLDGSVN